jgi:predicted dehydrogenase
MSDELRAGLLGAGLIAGVHARAYRSVPGVRVVAVADPVGEKAQRLASEHGAAAVAGLDDLLALDLDVVDVCTPPDRHADAVVAALRAGVHVFCEKPLARAWADAQRIVAADRDSPGLLMVGHVSRFEPDHLAALDRVRAGELGAVRMVTHTATSSLPAWSEAGWLADPARSGGPIVDQGVHSFDFAGFVTGSPAVRVHCVASDTASGPSTYALATVRYADGALAHVETSWGHPAGRGFKLACEVVGTEGRLSWSYDDVMSGVLHPREGHPEWWDVLGERGFAAELCAFVEAVRAGGPSPVPAHEALESLRIALAALESARTGQTVDLTDWQPS